MHGLQLVRVVQHFGRRPRHVGAPGKPRRHAAHLVDLSLIHAVQHFVLLSHVFDAHPWRGAAHLRHPPDVVVAHVPHHICHHLPGVGILKHAGCHCRIGGCRTVGRRWGWRCHVDGGGWRQRLSLGLELRRHLVKLALDGRVCWRGCVGGLQVGCRLLQRPEGAVRLPAAIQRLNVARVRGQDLTAEWNDGFVLPELEVHQR
mmetsp:Transcript_7498/g.21212  ORF Transcript_7498/g.21212 Transcript_7498/m.21212 type:complete len:202 (+) Transcript_7498:1065-1670(+)